VLSYDLKQVPMIVTTCRCRIIPK